MAALIMLILDMTPNVKNILYYEKYTTVGIFLSIRKLAGGFSVIFQSSYERQEMFFSVLCVMYTISQWTSYSIEEYLTQMLQPNFIILPYDNTVWSSYVVMFQYQYWNIITRWHRWDTLFHLRLQSHSNGSNLFLQYISKWLSFFYHG